MGGKTMWILSYSLAVLLALGACDDNDDDDIATVYAYSSGSNGGYPASNPSQSMQEVKQSLYNFYGLTDVPGPVSKDTVKWGFDTGSYRSQTGSSGTPMTSEKPGSASPSTSQPGFHVGSAATASLVSGSVRNSVNMAMSGYDSTQSTNVQDSEVITSVLTPLQQSSYSVSKPVQVVSSIPLQISSMSVARPSSQQLVQTMSQSSSEQPVSSGTMSQASPQQLSQAGGKPISQTSLHSAVQSGIWPLKPLKGKHHQSGSRPVHNVMTSSLTPSAVSQPSLSILQYGSVPSSLVLASSELVSQSAQSIGQTVSQPSNLQPPRVIDLSVVQPSSQLIQQSVDTSGVQPSNQQLLQASQSVSQSSVQPVDGSSVFAAQPSGLTPLKHHKGKPHFGSKPHQTLSFTSVGQTSSQKPVQISYHSGPQPVLQLPVQASYQLEALSPNLKPGQTSYELVSKPSVQEPPKVSFSAAPLVQKPAQASYQLVAQLGVQQPAQSSYGPVVKQNGQNLFKPVQSHGIHQIGSKLYSCHELPQHSYQRRHHPSTLSLPTLAQDIKPVLPSDPIPMDLKHPNSFTSTLKPAHLPGHPVMLQSEQPVVLEVQSSGLSLVKPGPVTYSLVSQPTGTLSRPLQQPAYQPTSKLWQEVFLPLVKPNNLESSSFEAHVLPSHLSSVSGQFVSQPQILPSGLSLPLSSSYLVPVQASQSASLSNLQPEDGSSVFVAQPSGLTPLKHHKGKHHFGSSYKPQVLSSYETIYQPVLQSTSVVVPSNYQSTSSQAWSSPIVSNDEVVLQSVQPELPVPAQLNYQSVTGQNAPGLFEGSRHPSQKLLKLLQQVKS